MGAKKMPLRLQKYIVKKSTVRPPDPSPVEPQEMEVILFPEKSVNDKRPVVLFVMQKYGFGPTEKTFCGIGLRGKLTSDILQFSSHYHFLLCHIDSIHGLTLYINKFTPKIIIYNYHSNTTQWLDVSLTTIFPNMIHIFIHYDLTQAIVDSTKTNKTFHYMITDDNTLKGNDYVFKVARSLPFTDCDLTHSTWNEIPKIGFQGFGFPHKGIHRVAKQVCQEFDHALIRLHIPFSLYSDPHGLKAAERVKEVREIIRNTNIQLEVSHDFKDEKEIVRWLNENDVNCYFYDYLDGAGIASSPDYAIAARKPIAITRSHQFRHMWNLSPSICIEENSLKQILQNGTTPLKPLYEQYTHANVIRDYEHICDTLYKQI